MAICNGGVLEYQIAQRVFVTRSFAIFPALAVAFISNFEAIETHLNIL
jgi:nitrate reductase NapE component